MNKEDTFYLGKLTKTHGFKGELVAFLDVDDPQQYSQLKYFLVEIKPAKLIPYFLEKLSIQNNKAILRLQDMDDPDEVSRLVGKSLYLPLDLLPKLEGNKFYYHEVIGYDIIDSTRGLLGKMEKVLDYPNQDLFQVFMDGKEVLIPVSDEIIVKVDRKERCVEVNCPEGLLDLYLES